MQIVLLRGLAREAGHWLNFPAQIQRAMGKNCRIHLIDFPGCGKFYQQPALRSISAMVDHARFEYQHTAAQATEPLVIIGISMGGMVALDWAQRFPGEISQLILINTSIGDQPLAWRLRWKVWPRILLALLLPQKQREALVLRSVSNCPNRYEQHLPQWLEIQKQRPITRAAVITMLRAAALFRPQPHCTTSGLVLASQNDQMVSVKASEDIAKRFGWPITLHSTAGHDLPLDDGQWTAKQIAAFINNGNYQRAGD